jgi:hypothetical protein
MQTFPISRMRHHLIIIGACCVLLCGCGMPYFTQEDREKYRLTDEDILNVQFYLSDYPLIFRSSETTCETGTDSSHCAMYTERTTHKIIYLAEGTPGIAVRCGPSSIDVDFSDGIVCTFIPWDFHDLKRMYTLAYICGKPVQTHMSVDPNPAFGDSLSRTVYTVDENDPANERDWLHLGKSPRKNHSAGFKPPHLKFEFRSTHIYSSEEVDIKGRKF